MKAKGKKLSKLDELEFVQAVEAFYKAAIDNTYDWRKEAVESRDYVAGNQWSEEDLAMREGRPSLTYNRTGPFVDAVTGLYVQNRQEVTYLPRQVQGPASAKTFVLNHATEWVRDECAAEDEEEDAFIDLVVTGAGAVETKITFDGPDPEPMIAEERVDWIEELYWDPNAKKRNFTDKRWVMRVKPWSMDDIEDEWPDADVNGGDWYTEDWWKPDIHRADRAFMYKQDGWQKLAKDTQLVVCFEWYEIEKMHRVMVNGQAVDVPHERFTKVKPILDEMGFTYTNEPLPSRRYYRAFITGKTLLERGPAPINRFSWDIATGKRDNAKKAYYGLIRGMKDPQKYTNVLLSSLLHTVATTGKGIMAETDAFSNIHKAREQWGTPDEIVELEPGGAGKIIPKPAAPLPAGMDMLIMQSVQSFNDVTGIPVEMLGLTRGDQPGIVEAQRKQSGIAILSWAFDAQRKMMREVGRTLAEYVMTYIEDGRLVRVSGEQRYVPFLKQDGTMKFDIIIDEAPQSANQKERVWMVLQSLLPYMVKMGIPVPQDIFDYLPIPEALKESWKKQMQPDPQTQAMQQQAVQLKIAETQAGIAKDKAKAELDSAKAQETVALIGPERAKRETAAQKQAAETGRAIAGG